MNLAGRKSLNIEEKQQCKSGSHHQIHSQLLKDLNANYGHSLSLLENETNQEESFLKKTLRKLRSKVLKLLFGDFFSRQHDFTVSLVQYLNELTSYADIELGDKKFEELSLFHKKIDRLKDDFDFELMQLSSSKNTTKQHETLALNDLRRKQDYFESKFEELSSQLLGLEKVLRLINNKNQSPKSTLANPSLKDSSSDKTSKAATDYDYLIFENKFRGPEDRIKKRLEIYLDFFKQSKKEVLEIGSGRGELLKLFKDNGTPAYGLDFDSAMVECANEAGLHVKLGDAVEHLESLKDNSLAGIIAIQVIEHLDNSYLKEFLRLAHNKIEDKGTLVLETINPRSIVALTQHYFRDPTHVAPVHPDTIKYLIEGEGFQEVLLKEIHPFPKEVILSSNFKRDKTKECFSGVEEIANSFEQCLSHLDNMLFGYQDYFVKASVNNSVPGK